MNQLNLSIATDIRIVLFTVAAQDIVIADPGQDFELTCDVNGTEASTNWQINGLPVITLGELSNDAVAGHNANGRNIVIEDIMMNDVRNGSQYQCLSLAPPITAGNLITLYVAGEYNDFNVLVQCIFTK